MKQPLTSIEPLEPRIAPATISIVGKTATWTDFDGDIVTMKWTSADAPAFAKTDKGAGLLVNSITLDPAKHTGASFTITVKAAGAFGDGRVELGTLDGTGVALGKWNGPKAGIGALLLGVGQGVAAESFICGGIGQTKTGASFIRGTFGFLKINGDVGYGGMNMQQVASGTQHGPIIVTGSLRGDLAGSANDFDGFLSISGGATSLTIGGSVLNTGISQQPTNGISMKSVTIGGDIVSTTDPFARKVGVFTEKLTVGGSVIGAKIELFDQGAGTKSVRIGGSLVAQDGLQESGILQISHNGKVGKVVVKGSLYGADFANWDVNFSAEYGAGAIISTTSIGSITIGGSIHAGRIANTNPAINGGIQVAGNIGKLSIGGVYGYDNDPVFILAGGDTSTPGTDFKAIGKLSIKRDAIHAFISAGNELEWDDISSVLLFSFEYANAGIGSVAIGGNFVNSNIFAGVADGGSPGVNPSNIGETTGSGILGPVVIKGHLLSDRDSFYYSGFTADVIASITVAGRKVFTSGDPLRNFDDYITAKEL